MKLTIVDWIRIVLIVLLLIILFVLIKEIEVVKAMLQNPCALCELKSGARCIILNP